MSNRYLISYKVLDIQGLFIICSQYELCKKIRRYSKEYDAFHTYFLNLFWKTFEIPVFLSSKHIQTKEKGELCSPFSYCLYSANMYIYTQYSLLYRCWSCWIKDVSCIKQI